MWHEQIESGERLGGAVFADAVCAGLMIAAVVLAAGASIRLGEPKQLAMLGGETLLERAVRMAREAEAGVAGDRGGEGRSAYRAAEGMWRAGAPEPQILRRHVDFDRSWRALG